MERHGMERHGKEAHHRAPLRSRKNTVELSGLSATAMAAPAAPAAATSPAAASGPSEAPAPAHCCRLCRRWPLSSDHSLRQMQTQMQMVAQAPSPCRLPPHLLGSVAAPLPCVRAMTTAVGKCWCQPRCGTDPRKHVRHGCTEGHTHWMCASREHVSSIASSALIATARDMHPAITCLRSPRDTDHTLRGACMHAGERGKALCAWHLAPMVVVGGGGGGRSRAYALQPVGGIRHRNACMLCCHRMDHSWPRCSPHCRTLALIHKAHRGGVRLRVCEAARLARHCRCVWGAMHVCARTASRSNANMLMHTCLMCMRAYQMSLAWSYSSASCDETSVALSRVSIIRHTGPLWPVSTRTHSPLAVSMTLREQSMQQALRSAQALQPWQPHGMLHRRLTAPSARTELEGP